MSRPYIVQHEMNTNGSIDARVSFKPDNVGDLSYQQFYNESVSIHGISDDHCQPEDLTTTKNSVSSATNGTSEANQQHAQNNIAESVSSSYLPSMQSSFQSPDSSRSRQRIIFTESQTNELMNAFKRKQYVDPGECDLLAQQIGLTPWQVCIHVLMTRR